MINGFLAKINILIIFYSNLLNIYPNIKIREKMNEMFILTLYSHVSNIL